MSTGRRARWRIRAALQWNRLVLIGLEELVHVQIQAVRDPRAVQTLRTLVARTAESIADITVLLTRYDGRPIPLTGLTRGASWAASCLVASFGLDASLALDRWVINRWMRACDRTARRIAGEDGITARALDAVRDREGGCLRALTATGTSRTKRPGVRQGRR